MAWDKGAGGVCKYGDSSSLYLNDPMLLLNDPMLLLRLLKSFQRVATCLLCLADRDWCTLRNPAAVMLSFGTGMMRIYLNPHPHSTYAWRH